MGFVLVFECPDISFYSLTGTNLEFQDFEKVRYRFICDEEEVILHQACRWVLRGKNELQDSLNFSDRFIHKLDISVVNICLVKIIQRRCLYRRLQTQHWQFQQSLLQNIYIQQHLQLVSFASS